MQLIMLLIRIHLTMFIWTIIWLIKSKSEKVTTGSEQGPSDH